MQDGTTAATDGTTAATDGTATAACEPRGIEAEDTAIPDAPADMEFPAMLFVPNLVVVDQGKAPDAAEVLGEAVSPIEASEAYGMLPSLGEDANYDPELVDQIDEAADFLRSDEDPVDMAQRLEDAGIDAAPVSAVGFVGHWGLRPADDPKVEEYAAEVESNRITGYVAVVDSGIDDRALPSWMTGNAVVYDSIDTETVDPSAGEASHGTFVADLIRRIAPQCGVSFAKARVLPVDAYQVHPEGHELPALSVSNEMDVAYAVARLMNRSIPAGSEYAALNLSLGAYTADPAQDFQLVLLENVLAQWTGGPVVAAAGNEDLTLLHWPAALNDVISVAAADLSQAASPQLPSGAPRWFDYTAPGVGIVGVGGGEETTWVSWSGSSFATAVATALLAQGEVPTSDYTLVPGLSYLDSNGNPVP